MFASTHVEACISSSGQRNSSSIIFIDYD